MKIHRMWLAAAGAAVGAAGFFLWPIAALPSEDQDMKDVLELVAENAPSGCKVANPIHAIRDPDDLNQQAALGYAEQYTGVSLVCGSRRENYGVSTYRSRGLAILRSFGMTYCFDQACQRAQVRGCRLFTFSYRNP